MYKYRYRYRENVSLLDQNLVPFFGDFLAQNSNIQSTLTFLFRDRLFFPENMIPGILFAIDLTERFSASI